jgi:hypothetical protein
MGSRRNRGAQLRDALQAAEQTGLQPHHFDRSLERFLVPALNASKLGYGAVFFGRSHRLVDRGVGTGAERTDKKWRERLGGPQTPCIARVFGLKHPVRRPTETSKKEALEG